MHFIDRKSSTALRRNNGKPDNGLSYEFPFRFPHWVPITPAIQVDIMAADTHCGYSCVIK